MPWTERQVKEMLAKYLQRKDFPCPSCGSQASTHVALRQQRKMSLGDALIAGTALLHGLTLVTRNAEDFHWIQGLSLLNPFEDESQQEQDQQCADEDR